MIKKLMNNKVVKAGSWYTVTNFFTKGLSFLTIPIFTRILTTEDYGISNTYMSYLAMIQIVFSLDLAASVQIGKFDYEKDYDEFISSVAFLGLIVFAGFSTIFLIFSEYFSKVMGMEKILLYILVANAFSAFMQNFSLSKFQAEYKYKKISVINIVISVLSILLSIYLIKNVFSYKPYLGNIIGKSLPTIFLGIFFCFYFFIKGKTFFNIKYWKYALVVSVPLIVHALSGIINAQFDRIVINKYNGASDAGIYSFAYNIGIIISVLWASLNQAWVPWFFEKMKSKDYNAIKKRAKNYRDFFTLVYIFILFISPEIIKIMSEKSYWEGLYIVPFIFMAYYLNLMYSFEVNIEFYEKKTHLISIGTALSAVINVILNSIFVPKYGYTAAAVTTVISYFFLFIFHFLIVKYILKINIFGFKFHLFSLFYVFITTLLFFIFKNYIFIRIIIILVIIFIIYKRIRKGDKIGI